MLYTIYKLQYEKKCFQLSVKNYTLIKLYNKITSLNKKLYVLNKNNYVDKKHV